MFVAVAVSVGFSFLGFTVGKIFRNTLFAYPFIVSRVPTSIMYQVNRTAFLFGNFDDFRLVSYFLFIVINLQLITDFNREIW